MGEGRCSVRCDARTHLAVQLSMLLTSLRRTCRRFPIFRTALPDPPATHFPEFQEGSWIWCAYVPVS